jgi:membrane associated rhomboid family serine protease
MPPRRQSPDLGRFFTFGGRVPASFGLLLAAMLVGSIFAWQSAAFAGATAFHPDAILGGQLWRLVSWFFVQGDPFGLFFVGLVMWWVGPQLMYEWGERRFVLRLLGITAGASVATSAIAYFWPAAAQPHFGAWPTVNALIIAWAMLHPSAQVNLYGILPVTGKTLALLIVGGTVVWALAARTGGFGAFVLHFTAMGIAYALSRGFSPGAYFRDAQRRMQERDARRRAKHLKVIRKNGEGGSSGWMN